MGKNSNNAHFANSRGGGSAMRKVMALVLTAALVMSSGISSAFAAGEVQPREGDSGKHLVTVEGGIIDSGTLDSGYFAVGETISITADEPEEGKVFDKWTSDEVTFEVATTAKNSFEMPEKDVTVTANYTEVPASTYTIAGTITGTNDAAVDDASVQLKNTNGDVGNAVKTATNGTYTISAVAAGTYTIAVTAAGYEDGSISSVVVTNANLTGKDLKLTATVIPEDTYSIKGTITGTDNAPVEGATLTLKSGGAAVDGKTATTATDGTYTISAVAAGTYTIAVKATGYEDGTTDSFTVSNAAITGKDLKLIATVIPEVTYSIKGTITGTDNALVEGATLTLKSGGTAVDGKTATTANDGTYTISAVAAGTYTIAVTAAGYDDGSISSVVVTNANLTGKDLKLTATAATVTEVTVKPKTINVQKGKTQQFTATVTGTNSPAQTVTWEVTEGANGTKITLNDGVLTVAAEETLKTLTVTATSTIDKTQKGTATVTVTDKPDATTLVGIVITTPPTKTVYIAGDTFDKTGMVVTAKYQDSGMADAEEGIADNAYTVSPDGELATTDTKVTVSYTKNGAKKTADQAITVKAAPADTTKLAEAITAANKNKATATVSADGKDVEKTDKWVTQAVSTAYTNAIKAAQAVVDNEDATEQEVADAVSALANATTAFDDAKKDGTKAEATPILASIEITKAPEKTTYTAGERFSAKGMVVTATYQDSGKTSSKVVTNYTFTPTTPLTVNNKVITVSYTEGEITKEAKQDIKVTAAPKVTYDITATPKSADFADAIVGYKAPAAKTITITNVSVTTGNAADVELTQPTGKNYIIGALTNKNPIRGGTSTFTIAPRTGLAAGVYTETITVSGIGADNTTKVSATVAVTFTVKKASPVEVDKAKLNAAINAANTAKTGITVDDRAASSVGNGVKFVTTAEMNALTTALKAAIEVNENKDATAAQVNTAEVTLVTATGKFTASIKTGTYTSGGGGGGGGSSGGGTTPPPASQDKPSDNVGTDGKVDKTETVKEVTNAVADAVKNTTDKTADITIKNAEAITPDALKEIAAAATKAGGAAVLQADTVVDGKIEARLYIDPKLASNIKADIKLGVSLSESSTAATKEKFKSFDNKMAVASFAQQGSFGMKIPVAIKADLTGLNTKTLVFYSYDKATNKYIPIANTGYYIDKNGFLHFNTTVGGEIIITDKPLAKKK